MKLTTIIYAILVYSVSSTLGYAQGGTYQNVTKFFASNTYGTLAFALGARHSSQIPYAAGFSVVERGEVFVLPRIGSYCFVIQHYGGTPAGAGHTYRIKFHAIPSGGATKELVQELPPKSYDITPTSDSTNMPSYCFQRFGRGRFWIEVSSSDGEWFNGNYELVVR